MFLFFWSCPHFDIHLWLPATLYPSKILVFYIICILSIANFLLCCIKIIFPFLLRPLPTHPHPTPQKTTTGKNSVKSRWFCHWFYLQILIKERQTYISLTLRFTGIFRHQSIINDTWREAKRLTLALVCWCCIRTGMGRLGRMKKLIVIV